jgi:hypothetical protein
MTHREQEIKRRSEERRYLREERAELVAANRNLSAGEA